VLGHTPCTACAQANSARQRLDVYRIVTDSFRPIFDMLSNDVTKILRRVNKKAVINR
jgi:hypothetical protein